MLRRLLTAMAALLLAGQATVALAGGFAVTTLDEVPARVEAGRAYLIGYTIRQHGQRPFPDANTAIRVRGADGQLHVFPARPEGAVGHYVAEVRFPAQGDYAWEVDQSPFEPQPLGTIRVGAGPAQTATPPVDPRPSLALVLLRIALPVAALGACMLFALRLRALLSTPRHDTSAAPLRPALD